MTSNVCDAEIMTIYSDHMNIPSFTRSVSRGSAVGWFLVLLLVCGAGAGYYLYQDNLGNQGEEGKGEAGRAEGA